MKNTLLLTLGLLAAVTLWGQGTGPLKETAPEEAGISAEGMKRMDALLQRFIEEKKAPGVAAIIVRNGKIAYYKAFGMRDLDSRDPLERDDIFRIASMTKAITSTAAMMLFEEGRFALDDPISKYLPEFKNQRILVDYNRETGVWNSVPVKKEITIRQLFNHTSGIGYGNIGGNKDLEMIYEKAGVYNLFTTDDITLKEDMARLGALPLLFEPGEKFSYGMNTDVLGYLVEVLSGMSLSDFFQKRIFEPLGMKDTYFYLPDNKKDRLVPVYTEVNGPGTLQKLPVQPGYDPEYPIKGAKKFYSGGAGLSSTALDYAIFLQMMLNGGEYNGRQILGRKTVELMTTNQLGDLGTNDPNDKFSLCFSLVTEKNVWKGPGSVGKFGWGGYFNTYYYADPKERLCIVLMRQLQGSHRGGELNPLFDAVVYGAVK